MAAIRSFTAMEEKTVSARYSRRVPSSFPATTETILLPERLTVHRRVRQNGPSHLKDLSGHFFHKSGRAFLRVVEFLDERGFHFPAAGKGLCKNRF
jgi:hypothetical protein